MTMATRLTEGQVQLRGASGVPMERVVPTEVDYMTAARAEANVSNVYAQILDRMATTINKYSADLRTKEGFEWVSKNPVTKTDIELAKEGVVVGLGGGIGQVSGDLPSFFNAAVRKARSLELASHFEIEGRNEISKMLGEIEAGDPDATSEKIETKIATMTNGLANSLASVDPEAALKFAATMKVHGHTAINLAREKEIKAAKEQREIKIDQDFVTQSKLFEAAVLNQPHLAGEFADILRRNIVDQAVLLGDASKAQTVRASVEKVIQQGYMGAVSKYITSPDFSSDPSKALRRLAAGDAGKVTNIWQNMTFDEQAKIRHNLRDVISMNRETTDAADKAQHEKNVLNAANLTSRFLNSGGRDKKALEQLRALAIIDPKAITPEKVFDLPKKLKEGEGINAGGEFKLKTEIMDGLIPNAQALQRRARELGVSEKRLNENILSFYISRNNEEERDIENAFRLEAKTVPGQTNLTQKQTDALIGLQSKFQKTYRQEVEKARAEGKPPPTRLEIRDRILKERRESVPAQRISKTLQDLNASYGVGGAIRKTGITFTEESNYNDIASQKDRLGLKTEDLESIRQSLRAIEEQRKRLDAL
jgi:hypothetical protein